MKSIDFDKSLKRQQEFLDLIVIVPALFLWLPMAIVACSWRMASLSVDRLFEKKD